MLGLLKKETILASIDRVKKRAIGSVSCSPNWTNETQFQRDGAHARIAIPSELPGKSIPDATYSPSALHTIDRFSTAFFFVTVPSFPLTVIATGTSFKPGCFSIRRS